jgi:chaperonin GroEL
VSEFFIVVQAGVNLVAELLGVTLGPKGRNVVLHNKYGPPKIVNDGETVLKEVFSFFLFL